MITQKDDKRWREGTEGHQMMNEERLILNDINTDGNKLDSKNEVFGSGLSTDDVNLKHQGVGQKMTTGVIDPKKCQRHFWTAPNC